MSFIDEIAKCVDCGEAGTGGELYAVRRRVTQNGKSIEALVILRRCWDCCKKQVERATGVAV